MEIFIGIFLAVGVGISTSWIGMDKDRALYPVMMIVIAAYYVLFACIDSSSQTLLVEIGIAVLFQAVAVYAFKSMVCRIGPGRAWSMGYFPRSLYR